MFSFIAKTAIKNIFYFLSKLIFLVSFCKSLGSKISIEVIQLEPSLFLIETSIIPF